MGGLKLEASQRVEVKTDLEQTIALWSERLGKLGRFAAGPTRWMEEDLDNPATVGEFEEEEFLISRKVLSAMGPNPRSVLVVGFGPAADLKQLLENSGGECYGVDCTPNMVAFTRRVLLTEGYGAYVKQFSEGLATDLGEFFPPNTFEWVIWKRLGNHLVDDVEWQAALEEVTNVLRPGGTFLLCESLLEDNVGRVISPGSKFRTLGQYDSAVPNLVRLPDREEQFIFAEDRYRIELYLKSSRSRS